MKEVETIVIGSGPGGYIAAVRAAQLGQKVIIFEKDKLGGVCLNIGCIPSKALITAAHRYESMKHSGEIGISAENITIDFSKVQEWKGDILKQLNENIRLLLKANKVDVVKGEAYFVDTNILRVMDGNSVQTYTFKNAIIGTGSRPVEIPGFNYTKRVIDSTGALNLPELPRKLVIIGGGVIGVELGTAYTNFGTKVTILEGSSELLTGSFEKQMTTIISNKLMKKGTGIVTNAIAKGVEEKENGVIVTYETNGEEKNIEADYVLVTVGRRPNTDGLGLENVGVKITDHGLVKVDKQCRTNVSNIYAIGDIIPGPQLAHKASYEGKIAAEAIAGHSSEIDYLGIPLIVFSEPELATVGYNEKQAKDEGIDIVTAKFSFAVNGRALVLNSAEGFLKLLTRKDNGLVIGGQIVGVNASDIIAEIGLAIESGMTVEDIAMTIHAHPTLGEITMEAAEALLYKLKI
ncbi:dihydrolipoamide dehydrogenase [Bacillus sp. ok061]|uniref:dihydrolipoyl dehydrogenase n=1 Tax=Bacillus sp. ok061 TaxID=1761766 RepID=UPI00089E6797|nr:dihydrolipoyl dehydrogenase [Bacillus sp. ok061]SEG81684.1 dihydrolipoamide dehydrogenase [Bacillus sp. ok061]